MYGAPAGRYISIHVGCTGPSPVWSNVSIVQYIGQADVQYTMAGRAYRPLGCTVQNICIVAFLAYYKFFNISFSEILFVRNAESTPQLQKYLARLL